jgi:uncharacterized RDD family membrane protein YckC
MISPGLLRRFAALLYECLLLLGIVTVGCVLPYILLASLARVDITTPAFAIMQRAHFLLLLGCYFVWCWLHGGQTLPMRVWKLRIIDKSGGPLRPLQAIFRYLAACLGAFGLGIGFLWCLIDHDRQYLHDRLAGSRLVEEGGGPRGRQNSADGDVA